MLLTVEGIGVENKVKVGNDDEKGGNWLGSDGDDGHECVLQVEDGME